MKIIAGIVAIFSSFLLGCNSDKIENTPIYETVYEKDGLFTINNNYDLLYLNGDKSMVIDKNVLGFECSDDYLVYSKSNNEEGYDLMALDLDKNEKETLKTIKYDSFMLHNNTLFFTENYNIKSLNLDSKHEKTIYKTSTDDIVFHDIDNNVLLISHLKGRKANLVAINISNSKKIGETTSIGSKYKIKDEYLYGINKDNNLFRLDKEGIVDVVPGIEMVSFEIYDQNIFYLDVRGKLHMLELSGSNRHIASNILDFKIFNNIIYYTTSVDDKLYRTRFNRNDKEIVLSGIGKDLYLHVIR